jgi:hypothetical protein
VVSEEKMSIRRTVLYYVLAVAEKVQGIQAGIWADRLAAVNKHVWVGKRNKEWDSSWNMG